MTYRTSTQTSARKISYSRCLGSDAWRYEGRPRCDQRPIRQELLDELVWSEVVRLLEDPTLIETEISRRLDAARDAAPTKRQQDALLQSLKGIFPVKVTFCVRGVIRACWRMCFCIMPWIYGHVAGDSGMHGGMLSSCVMSTTV
ncbi:protein of unknown function [Acidithiobacillus ferrivorans]|uniref:Uncharacterized protein n=1 Tax=Acidithiobacillus ferrivorans TaxID=160808 RepID=A0A060USA5_9PROT|nr:hypothetical protein AFERRI_530205 [Acidithiobacillus ferrivorans]SMH67669.1 protein of unknown function [Acidithiobacillus ferrivorans]